MTIAAIFTNMSAVPIMSNFAPEASCTFLGFDSCLIVSLFSRAIISSIIDTEALESKRKFSALAFLKSVLLEINHYTELSVSLAIFIFPIADKMS